MNTKPVSFALKALLVSILTVSAASAATITVSAAASLKEAFQEIGKNFEADHTGDKVDFNFGGSGSLLQQIRNGAPADVFASADLKSMNDAKDLGLLKGDSTLFVKNELVAIVPGDSAKTIANLDDLKKDEFKKIALGNPDSVPAGRYTTAALKKAGLQDELKDKLIYTQNVRQALEYVSNKSVDIGFVYGTDAVLVGKKVKSVYNVPLDKPVVYPIAVLKSSKEDKTAQAFIDYVMSPKGRAVLDKYGFVKP